MFHHASLRLAVAPILIAGFLAVLPATADAQRRGAAASRSAARPVVRPVVVRGVAYRLHSVAYQPFYWRSSWWGLYGASWWGPYPGYPYAYGYGHGYGVAGEHTAALRLQVAPREAEVFVDGYAAGVVDDFDGIFQRLRLPPGGHEIVVYLDGHRTLRQELYLNPGSTRTIRHTMEPLAAGESMDERPMPAPESNTDVEAAGPAEGAEPRPDSRTSGNERSARYGTIAVRVQPADAEILVDGERWSLPAGQTRLAIQLAEGRHTVEVRRPGFAPYREDVLIRPNATLSLNVSLTN